MLHEVSFKSYNEEQMVQGWVYVPACEPKGIIQLIHGFGEHSRRYFHMIVAFMDAGYIVAADDHVGHGKTAIVNDSWGDWGKKGPHTMMEDEHTLTGIVKEMYPGLPYFLFGHSMGSLITRDYIATYGDELTAATLCGTCGVLDNYPIAVEKFEEVINAGKGEESDAEIANLLFGDMFGRCEEGNNLGNEWICHSLYVQKDHAEDPFDAFTRPTTNRSMQNFCKMAIQVQGEEWAAKVPKDLPIYNIAGDEDPFGSFGVGPLLVADWLINTGHSVKNRIYNGYRHEIHNYDDIKFEVEQGVVDFFDAVLAK